MISIELDAGDHTVLLRMKSGSHGRSKWTATIGANVFGYFYGRSEAIRFCARQLKVPLSSITNRRLKNEIRSNESR